MTKRPASRPSQLAGRSPVHPVSDRETASESLAAPVAQEVEVKPSAPAPMPVEEKAEKVGFYMKPTDQERAKRAHTTTIIHTGLKSWTAYVNEAVMAYTKQLEQQHNDSKPF